MKLPIPVPELPVSNLQAAETFYAHRMGFRIDWVYEDYLAGISRDAASSAAPTVPETVTPEPMFSP